MPPRLSICIATLNRAAFIGATLESLVRQASEDVEIIVVDGASTDNTADVMRAYQERCATLRYVRLAAKGGVDQDYCRAVELAQGEYVWLFTDDDIVKPDVVAEVLRAIRDGYSLVVVNAEVRSADLSRLLAASRLPFSSDRIYQATANDQDRFLAEIGSYLSFIGGVVIQRSLWAAREKTRFFGTEFVHVGVIFQSPLPGPVLVLARPRIAIRYGNAQWTARFFEIWMFKWPRLIWSFPDFSEWAKRRVTSPEPWRNPGALFLFRARGVYSEMEYRTLIEPHLGSAAARRLARLIAHLPGCATNLLASLYAWVRNAEPLAVDLRLSPFDYQRCRRHSE
jgi:glycosyltransferase involved in cell wall biosynthesis